MFVKASLAPLKQISLSSFPCARQIALMFFFSVLNNDQSNLEQSSGTLIRPIQPRLHKLASKPIM